MLFSCYFTVLINFNPNYRILTENWGNWKVGKTIYKFQSEAFPLEIYQIIAPIVIMAIPYRLLCVCKCLHLPEIFYLTLLTTETTYQCYQ